MRPIKGILLVAVMSIVLAGGNVPARGQGEDEDCNPEAAGAWLAGWEEWTGATRQAMTSERPADQVRADIAAHLLRLTALDPPACATEALTTTLFWYAAQLVLIDCATNADLECQQVLIPLVASYETGMLEATATLSGAAGPDSYTSPAAVTVTTTREINVRSGPGAGYPVVDQLGTGQTVEVLARRGDWLMIEPGRWVASWVVETDGDIEALPVHEGPEWNCYGDLYACGDFDTCEAAMDYFTTCPGDPSKLDKDGDGTPCESLCGA